MKLDPIIVSKLHKWLGKEGRHFFRTLAKLYKGDVDPVMKVKCNLHLKGGISFIPHPVHFREGMQVRNYLRGLEECQNWTHDQFENDYIEYIKAAMVENNI